MRKWLNRLPPNPSTITGRMLGIAAVASLLAVVDNSLIPLLSQLLWLSVIAFVSGLVFRPRLQICLNSSQLLTRGQATVIEIVVKNVGTLPAYDLQLAFLHCEFGIRIDRQPQTIAELGASEQVVLQYPLQATERGEHRLPLMEFASLFPLGMFRFVDKRMIEGTLLVAPNYETIALEELIGRNRESTLSEFATTRHRAVEYVGSREFREGLQVRRWDFAAWARLGVPTIREFHEANSPSALIVVDVFRSANGKVDDRLETILSRAATTAAALDRNGFHINLVIAAENIEYLEGQSNYHQLDTILRSFAKVTGSPKQVSWEKTWELVDASRQSDWTLHFFLRSDHAAEQLALMERAESMDASIDWIPKRTATSRDESSQVSEDFNQWQKS